MIDCRAFPGVLYSDDSDNFFEGCSHVLGLGPEDL